MSLPGSSEDAPVLPLARFDALGTTASVIVTEPSALDRAEALLRGDLDDLDITASRFRADSEICALSRTAGRRTRVSPLLLDLLAAAVRAAQLTDGLVDPTVGTAMETIGYDRDYAALAGCDARWRRPAPVAGWRNIGLDVASGTVAVPAGVRLDLGATAKAQAADRAADRIARDLGCGVLVEIGGDIAVRGSAPEGGWWVGAGEDHRPPENDRQEHDEPVVAIHDGAVATSSTTARTWQRAGRAVHHIVDPRTGDVAPAVWRAVTVAAATCLDANTASTAAVVLGHEAPRWLHARGLPALLIDANGTRRAVGGWPDPVTAVTVRSDRSA